MCLMSSISSVLCWWVVGSVFHSSDVLISSVCVGGSLKLFQFLFYSLVCQQHSILPLLPNHICVDCVCMLHLGGVVHVHGIR